MSEEYAPQLLTSEDVFSVRFPATKFRDGYDQNQIDDYLDEVVRVLSYYEALSASPEAEVDLTYITVRGVDVREVDFDFTRMRVGYDQDAVDDYLDQAAATLEAYEQFFGIPPSEQRYQVLQVDGATLEAQAMAQASEAGELPAEFSGENAQPVAVPADTAQSELSESGVGQVRQDPAEQMSPSVNLVSLSTPIEQAVSLSDAPDKVGVEPAEETVSDPVFYQDGAAGEYPPDAYSGVSGFAQVPEGGAQPETNPYAMGYPMAPQQMPFDQFGNPLPGGAYPPAGYPYRAEGAAGSPVASPGAYNPYVQPHGEYDSYPAQYSNDPAGYGFGAAGQAVPTVEAPSEMPDADLGVSGGFSEYGTPADSEGDAAGMPQFDTLIAEEDNFDPSQVAAPPTWSPLNGGVEPGAQLGEAAAETQWAASVPGAPAFTEAFPQVVAPEFEAAAPQPVQLPAQEVSSTPAAVSADLPAANVADTAKDLPSSEDDELDEFLDFAEDLSLDDDIDSVEQPQPSGFTSSQYETQVQSPGDFRGHSQLPFSSQVASRGQDFPEPVDAGVHSVPPLSVPVSTAPPLTEIATPPLPTPGVGIDLGAAGRFETTAPAAPQPIPSPALEAEADTVLGGFPVPADTAAQPVMVAAVEETPITETPAVEVPASVPAGQSSGDTPALDATSSQVIPIPETDPDADSEEEIPEIVSASQPDSVTQGAAGLSPDGSAETPRPAPIFDVPKPESSPRPLLQGEEPVDEGAEGRFVPHFLAGYRTNLDTFTSVYGSREDAVRVSPPQEETLARQAAQRARKSITTSYLITVITSRPLGADDQVFIRLPDGQEVPVTSASSDFNGVHLNIPRI